MSLKPFLASWRCRLSRGWQRTAIISTEAGPKIGSGRRAFVASLPAMHRSTDQWPELASEEFAAVKRRGLDRSLCCVFSLSWFSFESCVRAGQFN